MIVDALFQAAITLPSPRIAFRMTDTETSEVITSVGDGLLIEAPWEFVSDSFVGEFPIWKLKASFIYLEEKKSYVNHEFYCEVGAYSHDGTNYTTINWIPIGYFKVSEDGQTTNEIAKQIDLVLYCRGTQFNDRYEPLDFPLTGREIIEEIADRCNVVLSQNQDDLIFDDYVFNQLNLSEGQAITYREIIRQYAELNMASAYINRAGELVITSVFNKLPISEVVSNFDYSELKSELVYGPINSLIYSNKAVDDEQSYQEIESKDDTSIGINGKKSIEFSNNAFIDPADLEEQQSMIDTLFLTVNGFSYTPFEIDYFGRPDFDPYDLVPLLDMSSGLSLVPLTNMSFNYNGGLIGTLKTKELPETLAKPEIPNIFERVNNAEIRVNRQENLITGIVSQSGELAQSVTDLESGLNSLDDTVNNENTGLTSQIVNILFQQTQFTQKVNSFEFLFEKMEEHVQTLDEGTQATFQEFRRWIRFIEGVVILGDANNPISLEILYNRISFKQSGTEVAYISNNQLFITDGRFINSLRIGNFVYRPRENGSLSFGIVGG